MGVLKALAWPLTVAACFAFACIYFRKQVVALLDRTTSVGKNGLKTSGTTGQASQEIEKLKEAQELVEALRPPVLKEREEQIRRGLKEKGLDVEGQTVNVLIRYLATTELIAIFEALYRIIFGSQISLLKAANENRAGGLPHSFVQDHFVHVRDKFSPAFDQWEVETYMRFLLSSRLVLRDAEVYRITDFGVEFLGWMVIIGTAEGKGL